MTRYETGAAGEPLSKRIWRSFAQSPDAGNASRRRAIFGREITLTGAGDHATDTHRLVNLVRVEYHGADAPLDCPWRDGRRPAR
jgi:two-component system capsular synthesis sensor histidine kinase RcsC